MKSFILTSLILAFSSHLMAQVTCQSKATASCANEDGMCMEFFETEYSDPEVWENMCDGAEGEFSQTPCDTSLTLVKCLTAANIMMPVIHFREPFSAQDARTTCSMMGGVVCQ